jgi:type II secretory pathway component PulF
MLYQYYAKNERGEVKSGEIEAENPQTVYAIIRKEGFFVTSVQPKTKQKSRLSFSFLEKVSLKDLAVFTKEIQVMLKAGLAINTALGAQAEESENKKLSRIAKQLEKDVAGGTPLSQALQKFPEVFSPVYISTIRSGEVSGKLIEVLSSLETQLEKDYALQTKIKSSMTYPLFIIITMFAIMGVIFVYVIPSLSKLFNELSGSLPPTTKLMIGVSNFILHFWWLILIILAGIVIFILQYRKTPSGKRKFDWVTLHFPILGKLAKKIYIAKFCRTASTLIRAGLPILEVIKNTKAVIPNYFYLKSLEKAQKQVENGIPLSETLKNSPYFPRMVSHLIAVGETSGKIEESLDILAEYFEKEVAAATDALTSLIEPLLIVIIGIGVAFIALSVIQPIYSLARIL